MKKRAIKSNCVTLSKSDIEKIESMIAFMRELADSLDLDCENQLVDENGEDMTGLIEDLSDSVPDIYEYDFKEAKSEVVDNSAWECPSGVNPDAFYGNFQ